MEIALSAVLLNRQNNARSVITRTVTGRPQHVVQISRAFDVDGAIKRAVETEDAIPLCNCTTRSVLMDKEDDCGLINGYGVSPFVLDRIHDFRHAIRTSLDEHRIDSITIKVV